MLAPRCRLAPCHAASPVLDPADSEAAASENDHENEDARPGAKLPSFQATAETIAPRYAGTNSKGSKRRSGALQPLPLQSSSAAPSAEQEPEPRSKQPLHADKPASSSQSAAKRQLQQQPQQQQQRQSQRGVKRANEPEANSNDLPPPSPPKKAKTCSSAAEPAGAATADSRGDSQPVTMGDLRALLAHLMPAQTSASAAPATAAPFTAASAAPAALATPQAPLVDGLRIDNGWLNVKAHAEALWLQEQMAAIRLQRDTLLLQQAYQAGQRSRS